MLGATMWRHQYSYFGSTYSMAVIDPPGIGRSEPLRRPISLEDSARCLVEILDEFGIDRCLLVGNSWGAMLATTFPAWHSERLTGAVAVNTTASLPTMPETIQMSLLANLLNLHETLPEWWLKLAQHHFVGDQAGIPGSPALRPWGRPEVDLISDKRDLAGEDGPT